jgi:hypothetical protein
VCYQDLEVTQAERSLSHTSSGVIPFPVHFFRGVWRRRSSCTTNWRSFLTNIWRHRVLEIGKHTTLSDCGGQDAKTREPPGDTNRCSQNAHTPARRRVVGCILSPFFYGDRDHEFFGERRNARSDAAHRRPCATAGLRNFMTVAVRRCYWRTWRGFGTEFKTASIEETKSCQSLETKSL